MITRRELLKFIAIAGGVFTALRFSKAGAAEHPFIIDISEFNIFIPQWLLDKNKEPKNMVRAMSIQKDKASNKLIITFSDGMELRLDPETSVNRQIKKTNNRVTRRSMLLKRIISYSLDAAYRSIANKRAKDSAWLLKKQFENYQAEEILEFVTIRSMYKLLIDLKTAPKVSGVKWVPGSLSFAVHEGRPL